MFSMKSKHQEVILYTIFGLLTTLVNWLVYGLFLRLGTAYGLANFFAFIAAIVFAYVTNRKYVFESQTEGFIHRMHELFRFLLSRAATFFIELLGLYVMIDWLGFSEMLPKVIMTGVVIVLNYVFSKTMVFVKQL